MKSSLQHCTHVSSQSHKSSSPFLFFFTQLIAIKRVCSLFLYNLLLYSLDWKNIQKKNIESYANYLCADARIILCFTYAKGNEEIFENTV